MKTIHSGSLGVGTDPWRGCISVIVTGVHMPCRINSPRSSVLGDQTELMHHSKGKMYERARVKLTGRGWNNSAVLSWQTSHCTPHHLKHDKG